MSTDPRQYPSRAIVAVGAVILAGAGDGLSVVIARRGREPHAGIWSLPGGAVELGETLVEAVAREAREETGLIVTPVDVVGVFDEIVREADGRVRYHYVIVDYLCRATGGALRAADDADEVAAVPVGEIEARGLSPRVLTAIRRGLAMAETTPAVR
ncbi:MAG TPA: NUDIX domain-containing protein [Vicinamibacterales bacterium]|jgi:ADP-ribose pyrophosphatase YjhB (NUDIX family)|nr:NUDIX domain-containing protein [Vicinamibacterales bacterium]